MSTAHRCTSEAQARCPLRAFVLLLLLALGVPEPLRAAHLVSAQYARLGGQEIAIEIVIKTPPPPSLIVILQLPAQVAVVRAHPATNTVNSAKGEVKWLLKGIKTGTLAVLLTLDQPVAHSEISGEIRYRDPGGGEMVTIPIARP